MTSRSDFVLILRCGRCRTVLDAPPRRRRRLAASGGPARAANRTLMPLAIGCQGRNRPICDRTMSASFPTEIATKYKIESLVASVVRRNSGT